MNRIFNFSAGPCTLPVPALESAAAEFLEFQGKGMSLIEMSHRSKEYDAVHMEAMDLVRRLYGVPDNYKILFLGGGDIFIDLSGLHYILANLIGVIVLIVKILFIVLILSVIKFSVARLRIDQMVKFSYRFMIPLSLLQLAIIILVKMYL